MDPINSDPNIAPVSKEINKVLWIPIGILVIGLIVGTLFLWQKSNQTDEKLTQTAQNILEVTTDPTADWKTYTNEQYGFEFKYPPDWELLNKNGGISLVKNGPRQNQSKDSIEFFDGASLFISIKQTNSLKIPEGDQKFSESGFNGFLNDTDDGSVNNEYIEA